MKRLIPHLLTVSCLVVACTPQPLPPTPTPNHTATASPEPPTAESSLAPEAATIEPSPTPVPSPTAPPGLGFELPEACSSFDPAIEQVYYSNLTNGACDHPAISPDGSWIFFATPYKTTTETNTTVIKYEGNIVSTSELQSASFPIYRSTCGRLYPEWTDGGLLVLSDAAQDFACGQTVIYDPLKDKILATLDGALVHVQDIGWAHDKSALFSLSPSVPGPACSETLSGFDFHSLASFPVLSPKAPGANVYVVVGDPVWMPESKILLATIRDGKCGEGSNGNNCTYSNAYIIEISFTEYSIRTSRPFFDPAIDFSIRRSKAGKIELSATPFRPITCTEVLSEESLLENKP